MAQEKTARHQDERANAAPATHTPPHRTTSTALLGGQRELVIEHHGRDYRLRLTQQGKLILTA